MMLCIALYHAFHSFYLPSTETGPMEELRNLNPDVVRSFVHDHILHNPKEFVVAGAGIGHDELVDMAKYHFGHLSQNTVPEGERTIPSIYRGGEQLLQHSSVDGFTRIALAYELGGWHSDDLVPTCVLQTLLGGGNSFSAGGPGKGMYSRLYRQVLNRYFWAESAEAFTVFNAESGLFGMSGSSVPGKSGDVVRVLAEHFGMLSVDLVTDEEFERARNMLKNNVLSQLESRLVVFEDIGRQVLTYGHREDTHTMCRKIDAVTKEDLRELIRRAMQQPPTLAAVGDDLSQVPSHKEVCAWFDHQQ
jgi:processing peptidase subunit alpha